MPELWDLYTRNRVVTGQTIRRGEDLPEDRFHLVVHVWIKNPKGEFLVTRRAPDRPTFPNQYECIGGSVLAGEDSLQGALRESFEEAGIRLRPEEGRVVRTVLRERIGGARFNDILDVWLFETDAQPDLALAPTHEATEAKWRTPAQIEELFSKGLFVYTLDYFFSVVANA